MERNRAADICDKLVTAVHIRETLNENNTDCLVEQRLMYYWIIHVLNVALKVCIVTACYTSQSFTVICHRVATELESFIMCIQPLIVSTLCSKNIPLYLL